MDGVLFFAVVFSRPFFKHWSTLAVSSLRGVAPQLVWRVTRVQRVSLRLEPGGVDVDPPRPAPGHRAASLAALVAGYRHRMTVWPFPWPREAGVFRVSRWLQHCGLRLRPLGKAAPPGDSVQVAVLRSCQSASPISKQKSHKPPYAPRHTHRGATQHSRPAIPRAHRARRSGICGQSCRGSPRWTEIPHVRRNSDIWSTMISFKFVQSSGIE